jgi:hypothetical protein
MSFMPLGPCCLQGNTLKGEPRGEMQMAGPDGVHVDRYVARPATNVDPKAACILYYDVFGFNIVRTGFTRLPWSVRLY